MKKSEKVWSIVLVLIGIILAIVIFLLSNNKNIKNVEWDIKIYEIYNNPLAGRSLHESRTLLINSKKCVGKVTYLDADDKRKETKTFKIKKQDINKILDLAEEGEGTNDRDSSETYHVYKIITNKSTTFLDLKLDKEKIISSLFVD